MGYTDILYILLFTLRVGMLLKCEFFSFSDLIINTFYEYFLGLYNIYVYIYNDCRNFDLYVMQFFEVRTMPVFSACSLAGPAKCPFHHNT